MALNIARTERFIKRLKSLPIEQLDMSDWCLIDREKETIAQARTNECGTAACAAGHIVLMFAPKTWTVKLTDDPYPWRLDGAADLFDANGKKLAWPDAAKKLLNLSDNQASIFWDVAASKDEVVQHFEKIVARAKRYQREKENSRN